MLEKIKNNLFVLIIATLMVGAVGFYIYSVNRYKITGLSDEKGDVLASTSEGKIYADDIYEDNLDGDTLYWEFRTAIINSSMETTDEIKKEAKQLAKDIESYYEREYQDDNGIALKQQLSAYGFTGENALEEYTITVKKENELNRSYILENYYALKTNVQEKNPMVASLIIIPVENSESLSEKETANRKKVDAAIEKDGFAEAAKNYSYGYSIGLTQSDGLYGYTDSDDEENSFSSEVTIPGEIVKEIEGLKRGEETNWHTITDSSGNAYIVKGHVDETNLKKMLEYKDSDVIEKTISSFINNNATLNYDIMMHYADKLEIKYSNDDVKEMMEEYLKEMKENAEEIVAEQVTESEAE